ncbi:MAG TPA: hypothetical protein VNV63_02895 [Nitrospiria bacterium]|jgi:hypothetical protein|nr:hypothetical protein [Nitrospiria bacterium]
MECPRCQGSMVYEVFEDLRDDTGQLNFQGWRCIICGEILDPTILSNRELRRGPMVARNRKIMALR